MVQFYIQYRKHRLAQHYISISLSRFFGFRDIPVKPCSMITYCVDGCLNMLEFSTQEMFTLARNL